MQNAPPPPTRRRWLGLMASLPFLGGARSRVDALAFASPPTLTETPFSDGATMLVAGPDGGELGRWARLIQPALAQSVAPGTTLREFAVGAADGVTGANQFEARTAPDGRTVLLTPGEAALAWLIGDPRAKFDVANWVPVMGAVTPAVVVGKPGMLAPGRPVRIAVSRAGGMELPALLGTDLLGAQPVPVTGLSEEDSVQAAFARGAIDAVLLRGHDVPGQVTAFAALRAQPWFTLGGIDDAGNRTRDPGFPEVPSLIEAYEAIHGTRPAGALFEAWSAAAAASQLEFGVVLPHLTPASMIALWRRAGTEATDTGSLQAMAASLAVRLLGGSAAPATLGAISASQPALLALRGWLAARLHWRPS